MIEHWRVSNQRDADKHLIAQIFATSVSSVDRILTAADQTGTALPVYLTHVSRARASMMR